MVDTHEPGLRERKKRATRRALQRASLELVAERGLDEVTVEEIAAAADVSPRTFFNYFASKEDALSSTDPDALDEQIAAILARPAHESPWQALRAVTLARAAQMGSDSEFWRLRGKVIQAYPELGARLLGASIDADRRLAQALAERLGVDARTDPRPHLLAGAGSVVKRTAIGMWLTGGQQRDVVSTFAECFDALGDLGSG
jgi:AcrR family transcriptional regulator